MDFSFTLPEAEQHFSSYEPSNSRAAGVYFGAILYVDSSEEDSFSLNRAFKILLTEIEQRFPKSKIVEIDAPKAEKMFGRFAKMLIRLD